jgi:16S rRNA (adenine1518-N6/adenine1519-N6)-dimethyltransferase
LKAKKSYGQHFLIDENISSKIAHSLKLEEGLKNVLEIGPGKGMLTKYLIEQDINLKAVEADRDMVDYLHNNYVALHNKIISANFLRLKLDEVFDNEPLAIIGNFPYNISSQIVFKMIEYKELVPELVGMFQKEMAVRIISGPGSKDYGVISVLTQAFYEGEHLLKVGPQCFSPPPKVQSAVIRLRRKKDNIIESPPKLFRRVVKQAFSQRRKMLRNTMKTFIKGDDLLKDPFFQQRPEQLSLEAFDQLTKWIAERTEA